jgi:TAP-like protein
VKNRNEDAVRSFVLSMANGPLRLRYGAYYSIICNECMPFNNVKTFEDSSAGFWGGLSFYKDEFSICNIWNPGTPNSKDSAAVASNIPVLILSGEMDPIAPPSNGVIAQRSLPHSYLYVFQNTGHFVARDPHAAQLIEKFLKDPSVEPDSNHFIQTADIHFATDIHVHSGIISLAPRLPWNKDNAFYNGWIVLILIAVLVSLFFVFPGIIARKDKLYYWSMTVSAICTIYFIVRLGMIIFRMSAENFFLLGFGLPGRYAWILILPYFIFLLFIIQAGILATGKKGQVKRKQWFLFLLNIPFLLFILRFGLFY